MNRVFLDGKRIRKYSGLMQFCLKIEGDDNYLELHSFEGNGKVFVYMSGDNNVFKFGKGNIVNNSIGVNYWNTSDKEPCGSQVVIGDNNFFNGSDNRIIAPLSTKLVIGDGNLFAGHINIWGRNDQAIYSIKTKKRLNIDKDIDLGSNNWICEAVTVLPGAKIGRNSVVGLGSILNREIKKSNVLIVGVPAEVKKEGINWSRACNMEDVDFCNNLKINNKEIK